MLLSPCVRKRAGGENSFAEKADVCFRRKMFKNKCTGNIIDGTTGTLLRKSNGIRSRCAKDIRRKGEVMKEIKQISGTAVVVHDHEPDCQRISRCHAGKSSTDRNSAAAEEALQSETAARRQNRKHRQKPRAVAETRQKSRRKHRLRLQGSDTGRI